MLALQPHWNNDCFLINFSSLQNLHKLIVLSRLTKQQQQLFSHSHCLVRCSSNCIPMFWQEAFPFLHIKGSRRMKLDTVSSRSHKFLFFFESAQRLGDKPGPWDESLCHLGHRCHQHCQNSFVKLTQFTNSNQSLVRFKTQDSALLNRIVCIWCFCIRCIKHRFRHASNTRHVLFRHSTILRTEGLFHPQQTSLAWNGRTTITVWFLRPQRILWWHGVPHSSIHSSPVCWVKSSQERPRKAKRASWGNDLIRPLQGDVKQPTCSHREATEQRFPRVRGYSRMNPWFRSYSDSNVNPSL